MWCVIYKMIYNFAHVLSKLKLIILSMMKFEMQFWMVISPIFYLIYHFALNMVVYFFMAFYLEANHIKESFFFINFNARF